MDRSQSLDEGTFVFFMDRDKNGQADQAIPFSNGPPNGAMGLF